jgi:hypothetical protein
MVMLDPAAIARVRFEGFENRRFMRSDDLGLASAGDNVVCCCPSFSERVEGRRDDVRKLQGGGQRSECRPSKRLELPIVFARSGYLKGRGSVSIAANFPPPSLTRPLTGTRAGLAASPIDHSLRLRGGRPTGRSRRDYECAPHGYSQSFP